MCVFIWGISPKMANISSVGIQPSVSHFGNSGIYRTTTTIGVSPPAKVCSPSRNFASSFHIDLWRLGPAGRPNFNICDMWG